MKNNIVFRLGGKRIDPPIYNQFKYLKKKVSMYKAKIRDKIRTGRRLRNESVTLLYELYDAGYLDNADDIYDYMNSISGKYGLEGKDETNLSRFLQIIEYEMRTDSYDDVRSLIDYRELPYKELVLCHKKVEQDYWLCQTILHKMDGALFELTILRDRLKKMKEDKIGLPELQIKSSLCEKPSDDYMYDCNER